MLINKVLFFPLDFSKKKKFPFFRKYGGKLEKKKKRERRERLDRLVGVHEQVR